MKIEQGPLPEGWRWSSLDEMCPERAKTIDASRLKDPFTYVDISAVDVHKKQIVGARLVVPDQAPARAKQLVKTGDILVSDTRPNLNAVAMTPSELDGAICSTGFSVLRAGKDLDRNFLFSWVQSTQFVDSTTALTRGALYPAITDVQLRHQLIPVPPISEQLRIVSAINAWRSVLDAALFNVEEQTVQVDALSERIATETIGPGVRLPDDQSAAPKGWHWHKLSDAAQLESGHTPSRRVPEWWGGDVPWLALPDIRGLDGETAFLTSETTNPDGLANSSARLLPAGTVCLSRTASVGFVTVLGKPMATSQDFVNWICGPDLDPWFLAHALIASRDYLRSLSSGAIHKTIYVPTVKALTICLPKDVATQRGIAAKMRERIAAMGVVRHAAVIELDELNRLEPALLRAAFSGAL